MGNHFRKTRQREAISHAFETTQRPLHADEVLRQAQGEVPELGLATVYRTLKLMVSEGALSEVKLRSGATRYEPTHRRHTTFLYCDSCNKAFPLEASSIHESVAKHSADVPAGFHFSHCEVTFVGTCAECVPTLSEKRVSTH
ncbi:MAG: transcriptional repressor [Planctomycetes bacterium]|nr:transcriptional repressor [Planctomycetota bacterium]